MGTAARLVEPDGTVIHLLVTDLQAPGRLQWHWWRDDGELSAVEIAIEPVEGSERSQVRVVETLALVATGSTGSTGSGGLARLQVRAQLEADWEVRLSTLSTASRLASKLGAGPLR